VRPVTLVRDLLDFCYPPACAGCGEACDAQQFLCTSCLSQLQTVELAAACERCGAPVAYPEAPCPFCNGKGVHYYKRILRLGTFSEPLKTLIHEMKYNGRWSLGEQLADRLLAQKRIRAMLEYVDVIAPMPLHRWRHLRRGYNQAAVIAVRVARKVPRPIVWPVTRTRNTETQTHLHSRQERIRNLRNAFKLRNPSVIAGKHVLVIDDVTTTGATLQSFARTLRRAKPASLTALVIAIADPKHRDFQVV